MGFEPSFTGFEWVRREFDDKGLGSTGLEWVCHGFRQVSMGLEGIGMVRLG